MPDLSNSYIGLVKLQTTDQIAIIKLIPADNIDGKNAMASKIYIIDEKQNAILIEYLILETTLKNLVVTGGDERVSRIICQMICVLHIQKAVRLK